MKNRLLTCILALLAAAYTLFSQDIRSEVLDPVTHSGGSSMAYEYIPQHYAPAPDGYRPFYINHLGRHGSRNHTSEGLFPGLASALREADKAGSLTAEGRELKERIDALKDYMDKRYGDLTARGAGEHRSIAARMFENYPEVFTGEEAAGSIIDARSTLVPRCVLSMANFCMELTALGAQGTISMESSDRNNAYLNHYSQQYREYYDNGPWKDVYRRYYDQNVDPERMLASLFTEVPSKISDPKRFMTNLFSAAAIMQDMDTDLTLYDFFTDDEIFALWKVQNLNQYLRKGPSAIGGETALSIARPMLRNFLETSREAVTGGGYSAHLRFAHGENIMPFTALTMIEGACAVESDPDKVWLVWNDFKVTPMGANVQWIFYRNAEGDVIVKILHNEREARIPVKTDIWPYYNWEDVEAFYEGILGQ